MFKNLTISLVLRIDTTKWIHGFSDVTRWQPFFHVGHDPQVNICYGFRNRFRSILSTTHLTYNSWPHNIFVTVAGSRARMLRSSAPECPRTVMPKDVQNSKEFWSLIILKRGAHL